MSLLAGLKERRERGALSVELSSSLTRVQVLEETALSLVDCVQALVLDFDEIGAPDVREGLVGLRGRIRAGDSSANLSEIATTTKKSTLEFADAERELLAKRDDELRDIIKVLTEGLTALSGGAAAYHKQILEQGARFEAASKLSDLVRVRAAITTEVQTLRVAVVARQAADATLTNALKAEIEQLRTSVADAHQAARVDPLTQAANRGAFDEELARRCTLAASGGAPFALLLADIDHFKKINDGYGHQVGDRVLCALVAFLRDRVRRDDMIARWGGEEFAVLLPSATLKTAFAKAKAFVSELAEADWTIDGARTIRFTASIGVVAWEQSDDPATIVERADKALYAAKNGGRNRAVKG
ncbi:MAG TPA: GGDEF domain-containing protein [Kofleriaceae bacterium]